MIFDIKTDERKVRNFRLNQTFLNGFSGRQPAWGPLGYFTYKRTYARPLENGQTEEFWQTCRRVVEGVYNVQKKHCRGLRLHWNEPKAQESAQEMFERMWSFKWLPPGRGLWTMGTDMVLEKGSACLNNCAFVSTQEIDVDFASPFCFLMDMSMLGVGVGGDCRGKGKVRMQEPRYTDKPYVVEDSREGWVELIRTVLNSFVGKGYYPSNIDYSAIRSKGSLIKGFGGVASGSQPLVDMVNSLTTLLLPENGGSYKIRSSHIVDIFNFIGKCVVAGGIRRTAEIMFSESDDEEFIALKQDEEALKDRRWASNNSIFGEIGMDYSAISESIAINGEPGVIWLDAMRGYGRMLDPRNDKDARVMGSNPCSEQSLESYELCCLVETFPAHHEDIADYKRTLKLAYLYAKTVTLLPTHDARTNAVMMRNRRIGCSQSGIVQAMNKLGRREYLNWCDQGYNYIQQLDVKYSEWLCVPVSKKTTSVKPSGTVSLLCGATPGIHYPHSEHYIRNIRVADTSPLVQIAKEAGHPVEPCVYAPDTFVVSFPVKERHFNRGKSDVSIWEQFANASDLQKYWADNQVSVTITFSKDEAKDIATCLEVYEDRLKSVSLLPVSDHGYEQAPYIEISEDKYLELIARTKPMAMQNSQHEIDEKFCDGDSCVL
jgi:adenosylcobalamin-dependent ribonucleoside-triphosphate reductase